MSICLYSQGTMFSPVIDITPRFVPLYVTIVLLLSEYTND